MKMNARYPEGHQGKKGLIGSYLILLQLPVFKSPGFLEKDKKKEGKRQETEGKVYSEENQYEASSTSSAFHIGPHKNRRPIEDVCSSLFC